jgi:segregation and condensation protein A
MAEYKVQLSVFEGPLDLLLYLIKKEEVDIYEVNLTRIATQFIEYVDMMRRLDLDVAGEFLVMAATLMYIKSRELLPVDQQAAPPGEDEDEADPRWDLIRQLVEYKKFKDAAAQLQQKEIDQENIYPRQPLKPDLAFEDARPRADVSLFDLLNAVSAILQRFHKQDNQPSIYEDKWSVSEKIQVLLRMVTEAPVIRFSALFEAAQSRSEVVVTFLAVLELIRLKQLFVSQPEVFGEIEIQRREPDPPDANPPPPNPENHQPADNPI